MAIIHHYTGRTSVICDADAAMRVHDADDDAMILARWLT